MNHSLQSRTSVHTTVCSLFVFAPLEELGEKLGEKLGEELGGVEINAVQMRRFLGEASKACGGCG
jgi:hypothetical protein